MPDLSSGLRPWPEGGHADPRSQDLLSSSSLDGQHSAFKPMAVYPRDAPSAPGGKLSGSQSSGGSSKPENATTASAPAISTSILSDPGSTDRTQTLAIVLGTVLSVFGLVLVVGAAFNCLCYHRKDVRLFKRGVTPIDDDEINTWKSRPSEKDMSDDIGLTIQSDATRDGKHEARSSTRKSASVIIYSTPCTPEEQSPRTPRTRHSGGKNRSSAWNTRLDKELPQPPVQARAPNAREGLTDDTVPGDVPYIQSPKRLSRRLTRTITAPQFPRRAHMQKRSSYSSRFSIGDHLRGSESEAELRPRSYHVPHECRGRPSYYQRANGSSSSSTAHSSSLSSDWAGPTQTHQDTCGRPAG